MGRHLFYRWGRWDRNFIASVRGRTKSEPGLACSSPSPTYQSVYSHKQLLAAWTGRMWWHYQCWKFPHLFKTTFKKAEESYNHSSSLAWLCARNLQQQIFQWWDLFVKCRTLQRYSRTFLEWISTFLATSVGREQWDPQGWPGRLWVPLMCVHRCSSTNSTGSSQVSCTATVSKRMHSSALEMHLWGGFVPVLLLLLLQVFANFFFFFCEQNHYSAQGDSI